MMSETAKQLAETLRSVKSQRLDGELSLPEYYKSLLSMVGELSTSLIDEVESLSEEEIALQVPLVLLFVEEQVRKFGGREG